MPKGKKKGKYEHKRTEQPYSSDEDAGIDVGDNCSETSGMSDLKSNADDAENEVQEKLEEKVLEAIDALSARSNAVRTNALVALRSVLQRRNLAHVLTNHRATLTDHVARMLRRGKDSERKAAASIAPVLSLQIGEDYSEEYVNEVRPALTAAAVDKAVSIECRTECCTSLTTLCYLLEEDLTEILEVMRVFESIFSGSYLKGDGSVKVSGAVVEEGGWHAAALDGWALLLTLLPPPAAAAAAAPDHVRLDQLLHANSIEVRMAAGGALALAHEALGGAGLPEVEELLPRLAELARESSKHRARRDRKLQRATFRDILKYFEEEEVPAVAVRVCGVQVSCDTWRGRGVYSSLACSLGAALQTLAADSAPLRHALGLGDQLTDQTLPKLNKRTRHLQNNAASKARTVARNKNRDKRSAALAL